MTKDQDLAVKRGQGLECPRTWARSSSSIRCLLGDVPLATTKLTRAAADSSERPRSKCCSRRTLRLFALMCLRRRSTIRFQAISRSQAWNGSGRLFEVLLQVASGFFEHVLNNVGRIDSGLVTTVQTDGDHGEEQHGGVRAVDPGQARRPSSCSRSSSVSSSLESAGMLCLQDRFAHFGKALPKWFKNSQELSKT